MTPEIKKRIEQIHHGEVPEGYQKYGPYTIPKDWRVVKLGDVSECLSRPNRDGKERPVYSISNQKGFVPQNEQFEEGSYQDLDKSAYKIVRRGEFAYNPARINVGSIGCLKDEVEAIISSLYVCVKMDEDVDGDFFEKWIKTSDFYKEVIRNTEGSVRDYLFYENFSNIRMPLPSILEQKKIGEILTACDRVIELKQKLVDELKRLKKICLEEMFPQKGSSVPEIRFSGFTAPWEQRKLGDVTEEFQSGKFIKTADIEEVGEYPVYGGNGLRGYCNIYNHDGDFALIGRQGALCGNMNYSCGKAYFTEHAVAVKANSSSNTRFLYYLLDKMNLGQYSDQSAQPGLAVGKLIKLDNMFPSKQEQDRIGEFLTELDNLITLHQRELEAEQQKKKALMKLLLTGIVRTNP